MLENLRGFPEDCREPPYLPARIDLKKRWWNPHPASGHVDRGTPSIDAELSQRERDKGRGNITWS